MYGRKTNFSSKSSKQKSWIYFIEAAGYASGDLMKIKNQIGNQCHIFYLWRQIVIDSVNERASISSLFKENEQEVYSKLDSCSLFFLAHY